MRQFSAIEALKKPCGCGCKLTLKECVIENTLKYTEKVSAIYSRFFEGPVGRTNQDIPFSEEIREHEIERRLKEADK